jgi:hypothetical protein
VLLEIQEHREPRVQQERRALMAHRDHLVLKVLKALTEHKVCKVHKEHWVAKVQKAHRAHLVYRAQLVQVPKAPKEHKEFKALLAQAHRVLKEYKDQQEISLLTVLGLLLQVLTLTVSKFLQTAHINFGLEAIFLTGSLNILLL